jgi:hypothetical protein
MIIIGSWVLSLGKNSAYTYKFTNDAADAASAG